MLQTEGRSVSGTHCAQGGRESYLFAESFEALVIYVSPDLLHVIPVCDDAMFEGVPDLEQPSEFCRRLLSNEDFPFQCSGKYTQMLWPPYERGKVAFWYIVSCEASSDGAGPVVEHNGRVVKRVCHCGNKFWGYRGDVWLNVFRMAGGPAVQDGVARMSLEGRSLRASNRLAV